MKKGQTIAMMATSITTGIINTANDIIEVRDRINDPVPSIKNDASSSRERMLSDLSFASEAQHEDELKRRKKELDISIVVDNKPESSGSM